MKKYLLIILFVLFKTFAFSQNNSFKISLADSTEFYSKIFSNQKKILIKDSTYHFGKCKDYYSLDYSIKNGRLNGDFKMQYDSLGYNKIYGRYKNGKKEGVWRKEEYMFLTIPSKRELEMNFKNGKLNGSLKKLNVYGKLEIKGYCENGLRHGIWIHYDIKNGKVIDSGRYENGKMVGVWKLNKTFFSPDPYQKIVMINYDTVSIDKRYHPESIQIVQLVNNQFYVIKGWAAGVNMYDQKYIYVPFEKDFEFFNDKSFYDKLIACYAFSDFTKEDDEIFNYLKPIIKNERNGLRDF